MKSTIGYRGELTVYTKYKDKIVSKYVTHNAGKSALFNFIVNCLAGDWNASEAPKYIGVYHRTSSTEEERLHYQLTPATSTIKNLAGSTENSASIEYTFTIAGSNIKPNIEGNVVKLFNSANMGEEHPSAEFEFEEGKELQGTTVAAGLSYIVIWKMTIENTPTVVGE